MLKLIFEGGNRNMLIKDPNAKLMIKCPYCKRESNEYNWSLQTAARFSIGADTCPTLIMVILANLKDSDTFAGYRVVCPYCFHGINFEELTLPDNEAISTYARLVGDEYASMWI